MEFKAARFNERLEKLVEGLAQDASARLTGESIAERAKYSVAHTHRIFRSTLGESPGGLRRRLVLERSAHLLATTSVDVWQVAVMSGFRSPEAYSRAFKRAYRTTPTAFRSNPTRGWLPAPSKIHYWNGSLLKTTEPRGTKMNLIFRLVEHDLSDTHKMIQRASNLTDAELDKKLNDPQPRLMIECFEPTLRGRLDYLVLVKELWLAAVFAEANPMVGERDMSAKGLLARWNAVEEKWRTLVRNVEEEDRWDESFVDALCEPPETFTFGGMIAHVLDRSASDRSEAYRAFRALGHEDAAHGDPLLWEMAQQA